MPLLPIQVHPKESVVAFHIQYSAQILSVNLVKKSQVAACKIISENADTNRGLILSRKEGVIREKEKAVVRRSIQLG